VQTCIVHLIRYSMQFASWKERKRLARCAEAGLSRLPAPRPHASALEALRRRRVGLQIPRASRRAGGATGRSLIPSSPFQAEVRKIIYTHQTPSSRLNASVRKRCCKQGHFPSDQAATKTHLPALAELRHITETGKNHRSLCMLPRRSGHPIAEAVCAGASDFIN